MPVTIAAHNFAREIIQNDSRTWELTLSEPLPDGATIKYYFATASTPSAGFYVEGTPTLGNRYQFVHTFNIEPGEYLYQVKAIASDTQTLASGFINIIPDLTSVIDPIDNRTSSQKILELVEEAIAARLTGGSVKEYEIAGRRLTHYSLDELLALRSQLQKDVASEARAKKLAKGLDRNIYVRFAPPHY